MFQSFLLQNYNKKNYNLGGKKIVKKRNLMHNVQIQSALHRPWLALKIVYGLIVLIAGIDKFLFILSPHNENIVSALIKAFLPVSTLHFLYGVGIFEIILGIMILTKFTRWGALILTAWYLIINVNLFTIGPAFYLLILGNCGHAAGSYALAKLTAFLHSKSELKTP